MPRPSPSHLYRPMYRITCPSRTRLHACSRVLARHRDLMYRITGHYPVPLPAGSGRRATRPRPGTCSPRCCRYASGSSARNTRTPWPPGTSSPAGLGRRGTRPLPGICSPCYCRCASGCLALSTRTPCSPATTSPTGPRRRSGSQMSERCQPRRSARSAPGRPSCQSDGISAISADTDRKP